MTVSGRPWTIDFHCDTLSEMLHHGESLAKRSSGHLDAARLTQAQVDIQVFAVFSDPKTPRGYLTDALAMIELFWQGVDAGCITPILWREDMTLPPAIPGGLLSLEGGEPLGTDLKLLQLFYRLGVRAIGLTWNGRNALADGVGEADTEGKLTTTGRAVVAEMNRLGMLVDVSHLSEAGFWDVATRSELPIIASHSNCRALCDHVRNLTDEQLEAVATSGGVVGINFLPHFLTGNRIAKSTDIIRHIDHMLSVMGRGHIGLGTDYDGIAVTPEDLPDVTALPYLRDLLVQHFGADIAAEVMGDSFAALLARVLPPRPVQSAERDCGWSGILPPAIRHI